MTIVLSYILLVGIVLLLAAIGVIISFIGEKSCLSKQCLVQANSIRSSMDKHINPCDDFYSFVCRKFPKFGSTVIDDIEMNSLNLLVSYLKVPANWDKDKRVKHIAKTLYRNCINDTQLLNEGLIPLKRIIANIGGIPFLDSFWDSEKKIDFDVVNTESNHFFNGLNPVFVYNRVIKMKTYPSAHPKEEIPIKKRLYCAYSVPPNLYNAVAPDPTNYFKYCIETGDLFSKILSTNKTISDRNIREIKEAATFKLKLLRIIDKTRNYSEQPFVFIKAVDMIKENFGSNDTLDGKLRTNLLHYCKGKGEPEESFPSHVVVTPQFLNYIKDVQKLIQDTPIRVLATYMGIEGLLQMIPFLPLPLRNIYKKYLQSEKDKQNKVLSNRQVHCAKLINDAMMTALTTEYLKDNKEPSKGLQMLQNLVNDLLKSVKEIFNQITWASKKDQSEMLRLVKHMKIVSPLPPDVLKKLLIQKLFQEFYVSICVTAGSTLQSYLSVISIRNRKNKKLLNNDTDFMVFNEDYNVFDTRIRYLQDSNTIVVPMAFLMYPSLDALWPKYLSFGGLAVWIAHEVIKTVVYDNVLQPKLVPKDPPKQGWWGEKTVSGYEKERRCALNEYNDYLQQFKLKNNDAICLEDTLYNAAAVQAAYYAYKEYTKLRFFHEGRIPYMAKYTVDQIFFIKYASSFCQYEGPGFKVYRNESDSTRVSTNFKVLYSLRNFPEFIQAFKCQENDKMNKKEPCKIWKTVIRNE